jgi:hypothetical protein
MAGIETVSYLDRKVRGLAGVYAGGVTTWTLPFSIPVDGTEGSLQVALEDGGILLSSTRPAPNQIAAAGDYSTRQAVIGVLYPLTLIPSVVFKRDTQGNADVLSRLNIHRLTVQFSESTNLSVKVKRVVGPTTATTKSYPRASTGQLNLKVGAQNDKVSIEITDLSPGATAITGLVWTGEHFPRARPA